MVNLYYLFLPTILFLGIITSYTDIKEGKIRNKHIIIVIFLGIVTYSILFLLNAISLNTVILTLINFGIGAIVSVLLWFLGFWSAGDAKLFALYMLLIPTPFYLSKSYTFLTFLVNIIIPVAVFFIVALFLTRKSQEEMRIYKKYFSFKYLSNSILLIFSSGWIILIILSLLHIPSNPLFTMMLMMGIDKLLRKVWKFNILYVYLFISVLRIIFQFQQIATLHFWYSFAIFTVGFMIIRGLILDISPLLFSKETSVSDLRPGMIPSENLIKTKIDNEIMYEKVSVTGLLSSSQIQNKQYLLTNTIEGLTKKDISLLKKLSVPAIKIQQTIPFAPFMFVGTLIIIFTGVDIVTFIYMLIRLLYTKGL